MKCPLTNEEWDALLGNTDARDRLTLDRARVVRNERNREGTKIYGPMEFPENWSGEKNMEESQLGRDAGKLEPYFDLGRTGVTKLRAFWVFVPGYTERQWATVLPQGTEHYVETESVQHVGDYSNCVQRENYLFRSGKADMGRTFVSFPGGPDDYIAEAKKAAKEEEEKNWEEYLVSEMLDVLVEVGQATFWFVLEKRGRHDFQYKMRMETAIPEEAEGRTTAWGVAGVRNGESYHDIIDLRELNNI